MLKLIVVIKKCYIYNKKKNKRKSHPSNFSVKDDCLYSFACLSPASIPKPYKYLTGAPTLFIKLINTFPFSINFYIAKESDIKHK